MNCRYCVHRSKELRLTKFVIMVDFSLYKNRYTVLMAILKVKLDWLVILLL